jgi:hypothetical protein
VAKTQRLLSLASTSVTGENPANQVPGQVNLLNAPDAPETLIIGRGHLMPNEVPADLAEKAAIMREFGRRRAAGEPVSDELLAKHVNATNDNYTTGPEPGEPLPEFSLPDQHGLARSLKNLSGASGLLLVFHRSADW